MNVITKAIHILLEIDRHTTKRLEFSSDDVTGRQIKEAGGVPLTDDLAIRHGDHLELVTNDQQIEIHDGERFVALPPGTIS
ncbi:MAG: hypothetical protein LAN36_03395 [Acidobacteriia bacterium]|nr:hypothetical protein [Terriglobia bacterium]